MLNFARNHVTTPELELDWQEPGIPQNQPWRGGLRGVGVRQQKGR